ncbi:unnamed protein product [Colias eurytheme]|nr:unnamed protein product [Colias eurytheme]
MSGAVARILAQTVTHARQTSLVTSQPARQNYKTGRAAQPSAPTGNKQRGAVRNAQSTDPDAPPEYHIPWAASRRCGRRGPVRGRGYSSTQRAALRSAGAGALSATASARRRRRPPRSPALPALSHAPKRRIHLPLILEPPTLFAQGEIAILIRLYYT